MAHSKPKLITFGLSHFCEKARWALDWHSIPYEEIGWPPGWHLVLAKRCGARATTLPIILDGETVIQGSGAIIDWAESRGNDPRRSLAPCRNLAEAQEIERRADEVIGMHVRRLAYAETLPTCPSLVKPALFLRTSASDRLIGNFMWPVTRRLMMRVKIDSLTADLERWSQRPVMRWVISQYQQHRNSGSGRTYPAAA